MIPSSAARLLGGTLLKENTAWGAMTQLAKNNANVNWKHMAFSVGVSTSVPSFATLGLRSNSFGSLVSYTSDYRPADQVVGDISQLIGPLFPLVEAGAFTSGANIGAKA